MTFHDAYFSLLLKRSSLQQNKPTSISVFKPVFQYTRLWKLAQDETSHYHKALSRLVRKPALRSLETFKVDNYNPDRLLRDVVHHLTAKYTLASCYYSLFWSEAPRENDWYDFLAQGGSLAKLDIYGIQTTARMRHLIQNVPDLSFLEAVRWSQVTARYPRDVELVKEFTKVSDFRTLIAEDRIESLIFFFGNNPFLDRNQFRVVYDYMVQHTEFSLKGRTDNSVMRIVSGWHRDLRKAGGNLDPTPWTAVNVPNFVTVTGTKDFTTWKITQLLAATELYKEGKSLKHCVVSYAARCKQGLISIWSLTYANPETDGKDQKIVTIEMSKDKRIGQTRGLQNRQPTVAETAIVRSWASSAKLDFG